MRPHVKVYLLDFSLDIRFRYLFRLNRTFSDTSPYVYKTSIITLYPYLQTMEQDVQLYSFLFETLDRLFEAF